MHNLKPGAILPHMKVFPLTFVELDEMLVCPFLQPVEVSLAQLSDVSVTPSCFVSLAHLGKGPLCPRLLMKILNRMGPGVDP